MAAAIIVATVYEVMTVTDPYVIKPISVVSAQLGAQTGHTVNREENTLSVVSSNHVIVIADPGSSFQYEVLWLIEKSARDKSDKLLLYKYDLPQHAASEHINPLGSKIPTDIQRIADANRWR